MLQFVLLCNLGLAGTLPAAEVQATFAVGTGAPSVDPPDTTPPRALFTTTPVAGRAERKIAFDASPSFDNKAIVGYEWRFGDGTGLRGSRAVSVTHNFPDGEFEVSLTVHDAAGLRSTYTRLLSAESGLLAQAAEPILTFGPSGAPSEASPMLAAPSEPVPVAPRSDRVVPGGSDTGFVWKPVAGATLYDFRILDPTSRVSVRVGEFAAGTMCTANRCKLIQDIDLPAARDYSWQVRAGNSGGWSDWSRSSFSVLPAGMVRPAMPLGLYPGRDDSVRNDQTITFLWENAPGVESYRFQLLDRGSGSILLDTRASARLFCNPTRCAYPRPITLSPDDSYAWQIQAHNPAGNSGWFRTRFAVTANDHAGADALATDNQQVLVSRQATAPVAHFLINGSDRDLSVQAPIVLTFDPSASRDDGSILSYRWDFGDGSKIVNNADGALVSHSYTSPGRYSVSLVVTDDNNLKTLFRRELSVLDSAQTLSLSQAGRFLSHATFGVNDAELSLLMESGIEQWLSEQFELMGAPHLEYVRRFPLQRAEAARHEIWWLDAVRGTDQLRQRVAFALSQIFALPATHADAVGIQYGLAAYYDLLREHAFGNYRALLEAIVTNPVMALHTGMLGNARQGKLDTRSAAGSTATTVKAVEAQVDQGMARALLQRFSIGDYLLQADGSPEPEPAYTERDIENLARALTGWHLSGDQPWGELPTVADTVADPAWEQPLRAYPDYHDAGSKSLLGSDPTPPQLSAEQDLQLALDTIFQHPNVGPFIARQLIQKLVTSNPSKAYIKRVAAAFDDNGGGVRGDLRAVISAIVLDAEARNHSPADHFGKLREPAIRLAHLWRAFGVQPGTASEYGELKPAQISLQELERVTGQAVLQTPSVYGFFSSIYAPAGPVRKAGLLAPEFEIFSADNILSTTAAINRQIHRHHSGTSHSDDLQAAYLDFAPEYAMAGDPRALLERLDRLLLGGVMSEDLFSVLHEHLAALPDTSAGRIARVHDAVSLIMLSPDYLVQM